MELNDKIVIYQTSDGQVQLDVHLEDETVWLNANQMAALFGRDYKTIRKHINNAIKEELSDTVVVANFATTTRHGAIKGKTQVHDVNYYNLDVVISVGYRVKSKYGVEFRRWANRILKDYLVKGYAINNNLVSQKYEELSQLIHILGRTIHTQPEQAGGVAAYPQVAEAFLELFLLNNIIVSPEHAQKDTLSETAGTDKEQIARLVFQQRQIHSLVHVILILFHHFHKVGNTVRESFYFFHDCSCLLVYA